MVDSVNHMAYAELAYSKKQGSFALQMITGGSMKKSFISDTSKSLIELAWHFGPQGLHGECCGDLTMPEFIALDKVAATPNCPVHHVGYPLGFTKSGATRIVNRLEKKGYVEKVKSHEDGRVCCVVITSAGEKVLMSADLCYRNRFQDLLSKMSNHSAIDVTEVLAAMAKALRP
jgi:DNA-binding MarR family transcriptional regulator